ncbi:MAG: hypothetical protein LEGION0398_MBIBDBAK_00935 [Legionellaceae bacterium]
MWYPISMHVLIFLIISFLCGCSNQIEPKIITLPIYYYQEIPFTPLKINNSPKFFIIDTGSPDNSIFTENKIFNWNFIDGVIGQKFLKKFYVIIDYPDNKILLMKKKVIPSEYNMNTWHKVPFYYDKDGSILTNAIINKKVFVFLWDTGSSFSTIFQNHANTFGNITSCFAELAPEDPNCKLLITNAVGQGSDEGARPIVPGRP